MKKKRQSKVVVVEPRAGGGLHGPEKPGRSAGDIVKQPENQIKIQQQNEKHRQIKIHTKNEQQQHKNKNFTGGSPKQSNFAGSFWLLILKYDYKIITKKFFIWKIYKKIKLKNYFFRWVIIYNHLFA